MSSGRVSSRGMQDTHARRGVAFGLPCRLLAGGCSRSAVGDPSLGIDPKAARASSERAAKRRRTTRAKPVSAWINGVKSEVRR
jgi:hypothetical protein